MWFSNDYQNLVVERVRIPIPGLPLALEGFRIVQISDIHLFPLTTLELVDQAVRLANQLNPDLTVLTGDYVWHEVQAIYDLVPSLARLNARHGVYACLGNHDIWTNVTVITQAFSQERLPLLVNEGLPISVGESQLYLASLDDGWSGKPDLAAAMQNWPQGAPTVLLMHEPDLADTYSQDGRIHLQLSGHSHGGQVRFPFVGALATPYLSWKYPMGLYNVNNMWLYTNRGLGTTNVPLRVNCTPEVTEITLVRA
ncbi:MAG TPA: metallophosphoesterase [Chloroflexi bacterium]|nr:metallophosphoesterase [Chloroflexota bacterium]